MNLMLDEMRRERAANARWWRRVEAKRTARQAASEQERAAAQRQREAASEAAQRLVAARAWLAEAQGWLDSCAERYDGNSRASRREYAEAKMERDEAGRAVRLAEMDEQEAAE